MEFRFKINTAEELVLRDPEDTVLGRNIVRKGLLLMHELGFEQFTFKKLANEINTTEASIYRYFENKHRLLLYLLTWYWNYIEYLVVFNIQNLNDPEEKIRRIIHLLVNDLPDDMDRSGVDKQALHFIVLHESSKAYLVKEVEEINQVQLFKPYKDLCGRIASIFAEFAPKYPFTRSLSSTLLEMSHFQYYFMLHLPSLTDFGKDKRPEDIIRFLEHLIFTALKSER
jgi:AcrR family transcriptional regulator